MTVTLERLLEEQKESDAEGTRVESLKRLQALLAEAEKVDVERDQFKELLIQATQTLELDQDTVAGIMRASRPTVSRWLSGQAAPHPIARPSIFRELRKVASERLRLHKDVAIRA